MKQLMSKNFYPGVQSEAIREELGAKGAKRISSWSELVSVGTLNVPELVFSTRQRYFDGSEPD